MKEKAGYKRALQINLAITVIVLVFFSVITVAKILLGMYYGEYGHYQQREDLFSGLGILILILVIFVCVVSLPTSFFLTHRCLPDDLPSIAKTIVCYAFSALLLIALLYGIWWTQISFYDILAVSF